MSFASEPGRDDDSLPPLNIVIPDDARELDRDVLAYRREMRVRRRRERLLRLARPVRGTGFGGHVAIVPLIAICLALSLVGGALLSVATISPAAAPTTGGTAAAGKPTAQPKGRTALPTGSLQLNGQIVPVRTLRSSAIALVPANCRCGHALNRLADQATAAHVNLYFVGTGVTMPQLDALTARYGDGLAKAAADTDGVLDSTYHPIGLTVLLVFHDATAEVRRHLPAAFQLAPTLDELTQDSASQSARLSPASQRPASQPMAV